MSTGSGEILTPEQISTLKAYIHKVLDEDEHGVISSFERAGLLFPTKKPDISDTLPDEWDRLMEEGGIRRLTDIQLEEYLEKWLRLLGYAYWVQGVWQDRVNVLERLLELVKDYIFAAAPGGREQKAAIAGSHPLTQEVLEKLIYWQRRLDRLNGLIKKWEKIEFAISRVITLRSNKPTR